MTRIGAAAQLWVFCAALLAGAGGARAVEVEVAASRSSLSGGFADHQLIGIRLGWRGDDDRLLQLAVERKDAFGERATIAIGSWAQDLSERDRAGIALAFSDAPTIAAQHRLDLHYSRKLLAERNLVATLAGYATRIRDGHEDLGLVGSAAWYFADRQVAELGVRAARSNPGSNDALRAFAVYTWGAVGSDTLSLRLEGGREAYQSLGANVAVADFASREAAFAWRHWLTRDAGIGLDAASYHHPSYRKRTLGVAAFAAF